jgi:hypothetical protein
MSVVVAYPVEVTEYSVSVRKERASILLRGFEAPGTGAPESRVVGRIEFGDPDPIGDTDFITRGGFLRMDRSLVMLAGILDLLRNEKPLFLQGDGTLSSKMEPVGEDE